MANQTAQLFDNSPAVVHFINGLFGKNYKPSSKVVFLPSESVSEQKGKLKKIISDIPLSVNGDCYLICTGIWSVAITLFPSKIPFTAYIKTSHS